ncbi:MAG: type II toxin-antitoxin system RelE/ParE family toxin [Austwickia sp.]|jgi:mRNA interferase RelE/StbE|nr:MAG: type II toxin-antitoxin system RelE/ParE family toxin [Austwickia sp.]
MSYRVEWTPPARRDMARLPLKVALAVMTYVDERLAINPVRLSKRLTGELSQLRGARNGDYRILIAVDEADAVVRIVRVDHRAHAYR